MNEWMWILNIFSFAFLFSFFFIKNFLKDLLREAKRETIDEDKLIEYTDTLLQIFDSNKDGKLQLSEMAK